MTTRVEPDAVPALRLRPEAQVRAEDADFRRRLGRAIRAVRLDLELSQEDLARAAGMSRNLISSVERGAHGCDVGRVRRIAQALNLPLGVLFAAVPADPLPAVSGAERAAIVLGQGVDHR